VWKQLERRAAEGDNRLHSERRVPWTKGSGRRRAQCVHPGERERESLLDKLKGVPTIRELLQEANVHGKADSHMRLLTIETESRLGTLWDQGECNQICSKEALWEAASDEEMKIPWQAANEGPPVSEEQYQERFWRRRLDEIGWVTATKEFLAIEFKRTQDARSNYVERATAVAQEQYTSLLTGLQAVCQVKGWKIVFVGGTCGSNHVESFNRIMKALGVCASKWLVRRLLEEQDKVLLSYFAQKGGTQSKGGDRGNCKAREHVQWDMYA
jgi:hypothetical protein